MELDKLLRFAVLHRKLQYGDKVQGFYCIAYCPIALELVDKVLSA